MKKMDVMRRLQWCLPWAIFMGILMVNPSWSNAGNISTTDKYAWSENTGWVNFNSTHSSVTVYSSYLEGYVWAENIGWIKLGNSAGGPYNNTSSGDWGVNNDGSGNLSGYAWSENAGWINFKPTHSQVTINTATGSFDGYAWGENIGWIHFKNNSPAYNVVTTWAPPSGDGGGGGGVTEKLTISATSPSSGATGVSVDSTVSAAFSMYIKGSTLTTDTFKLSGGDGDVSGSVSTDGTTATFTPSGKLAYNTEFTATITIRVAAANAAGTSLESDYSWSFTTESATAETPTPASTVTPASTPSPTPVPSPTPAVTPTRPADMSLSKAVAYLSGDTVAVTVVDADRDANATSEDTLTTALKVTALSYYAGGDLILDLKENAVNSGTFLATIKTGTATSGGASVSSRGTVLRAHYYIKTETATSVGASSSVRSNIGTIKTVHGGTATVVYTDTAPNASTITKTLSFYCSDAILKFDAESYTVGSYAVVTHVDAEENEDATKVDTLLNHAAIETSSVNRAWMKLVETGIDTGTFKGSILVSREATLDYERIQASGGDTLTAGCTDEINTSGAPRWVTAVSRVVSLEPTPTPSATPSPTPVITPTATATPDVCVAEKITLSSYRLKVIRNQSAEVTVTVLGKKDCPVEGAKVRVLYLVTNPDDSGLVSVSRRKAVTNADGQAVFTVKAGNKTGKADLTFKTGSLKGARLVVKVSR